jgi:coenzyme F420-dependent glucose-6-phosphate dehydrogenase
MRYLYGAAMEEFPPSDLIVQAREAEEAGFDGLCCSDHLQPWWEPGESGQAWVYLGAAAAATQRLALGTGVTAPVHRYNPVVVAQAFATLEEIAPGRAFLGIGSGESLNESPCGLDWPPVGEQIERMEEALEIITRLFDGERLTHDGRFFRTKQAYLHTRPERRPPVYVSAFGEQAAQVAGRLGDGLWSLADPEQVPGVLDAYRAAAEDAGREAGEVLLHVGFSWAPDDETAFEQARHWKATQPPEFYTDDWYEPRKMYEYAEQHVSDDEFRESFILTADLDEHVERIRQIEELGATTVVLMNISGRDPHAAIRAYGEHVLPKLRAATTAGARG